MNKNQAHKKVMAPIKSGLLNIMYQWTVEYHVSANNKNWYDQILVFDTVEDCAVLDEWFHLFFNTML